jgi:DNA-binding transcriptional LysR family regulator
MDWDDIPVFLCVARSGSVLSGARTAELDHTTVSRRILRLESSIGARLFERAGRRMKITDAGRALQTSADLMESELLRRIDALAEADAEVAGRVRIGAPEGVGAAYLGGALARLAKFLPRLELELVASRLFAGVPRS